MTLALCALSLLIGYLLGYAGKKHDTNYPPGGMP